MQYRTEQIGPVYVVRDTWTGTHDECVHDDFGDLVPVNLSLVLLSLRD